MLFIMSNRMDSVENYSVLQITNSIVFVPGSSWSFHGKELPYSSYGMDKFPLGSILRKSIKIKDVTMYDLYLPLVQNPNPDAAIKVEKTTGPILLISSKMDNMWPSELAAKQIVKRLAANNFPYYYEHLSYDYGGHMFVPMDMPQLKMFKGDRGKNKEGGRKARMDSLVKTLEFVSKW